MAQDDHHKHFLGQVAQKALIEKDGKILLVKYPESEAYGNAGLLDFPGGRFHMDETTHAGLVREVEEEIGAKIEVDSILATGVHHEPKNDWHLFYVIYCAHLADPSAVLQPEEGEIGELVWKDKKDFFNLPLIERGYQEALKGVL